jgi:CSLREA domain-containing protein
MRAKRVPRTLGFFLVAAVLARAAPAATITVNGTGDTSANDGKCTLHEAILAANNDAASGAAAGECIAGSGTDLIHFAIPGSDSGCDGTGVCTILTGGLPSLDTALTIDGFTQTGATVNTLPYASNAVLKIVVKSAVGGGSGTGLFVNSTDITIRGLVINGGFQNGIGGTGGDTPISAKVVGCYVGTDVTGMNPLFNTWGINISNAVDLQIGGTAAGDRNIVSATSYSMVLGNVTNPTIQGNLIGVKANGTSVFTSPFGTQGVQIYQITGGALVGGSAAGAGNVIGGQTVGLYVQNVLSGTVTVQGNRIGTDGGSTVHLGNRASAIFADASPMTIGGTGTGEANVIAFNGLEGVVIGPFTHDLVGVKVRGNSIHDNAQIPDPTGHEDLGIDIGTSGCCGTLYGPTDNDPLDADTGSNGLQNFPLVNTVTASSIQGTLNSEANKTYTIDFYANTACSASGFGEGETYLGSTPVTTNGSGNATFNFSVTVPAGKKVTATATAPDGSTSEFSRCADLLPRFLEADTDFGATSDANGVLEPGETATVRPNWENPTELAITVTSAASALTGPGGASYSTVDATNDYGQITQKFVGNCAVTHNCFSMFVSDPATRPAPHWDANFVETMSTREGAKPWKLHLGDSFSDVPRTQTFYKKIETVFHNGITLGCTAATYCPDDDVPRDQMAIFIARAVAHGGGNVPVSGSVGAKVYNCVAGGVSLFTDVAPTSTACKSIHYIASKNVTTGCDATRYCPTQLVSRAQMAIFVAKGMVAPAGGAGVPLTYTDPVSHLSYSCDAAGTPHSFFSDVTPADAFCKHVNFLYLKNVIAGCFAGHYCPDDGVTRGEMAKFLGNAFSLLLYGP